MAYFKHVLIAATALCLCFIAPVRADIPSEAEYQTAREGVALLFRRTKQAREMINDARFDPDVLADHLGPNIDDLFAYVRDEIALEPYAGVMRFAEGTLMSRAGSACDQSVLLATLLRYHGHDVRFARASLDDAAAARVLAQATSPVVRPFADIGDPALVGLYETMGLSAEEAADAHAEATDGVAGLLEATSDGYDWNMETLQAEFAAAGVIFDGAGITQAAVAGLRDHCWVQVLVEGSWRDLDPVLDEKVAEPLATPPILPGDLLHRLRVTVEIAQNVDGVVTNKVSLDETVPLGRAVSHLSLSIVPEIVEGDAFQQLNDPAFVRAFEVAWPALRVGSDYYEGEPFDLNGNIVAREVSSRIPLQEAFDAPISVLDDLFGGGEEAAPAPVAGSLDRVTVTFTQIAPDGSEQIARRDIVRPPQPGQDADAVKMQARRQLMGRFDMLASGSRLDAAFTLAQQMDAFLANRQALLTALADAYGRPQPNQTTVYENRFQPYPSALLGFLMSRAALLDQHAAETFPDLVAYLPAPVLVAFRLGSVAKTADQVAFDAGFDILFNPVDAVSRDGEVAPDVRAELRFRQGLVDTLLEYLALGGGDAVNAHSVLARAHAEGVPLIALNGPDDPRLAEIDIDPVTAGALAADLASGHALLAPAQAVHLDGHAAFAWWRLDPATGVLLGIDPLGGGSAMMEYIVGQLPAILTMGTICGIFAFVLEGELTASNVGLCIVLSVAGGLAAPYIQAAWVRVLQWVLSRIAPGLVASLPAAGGSGAGAAAAGGGMLAGMRAFSGGRGSGARPAPGSGSRPVIETPGGPRNSGRFNEARARPQEGQGRPRDNLVDSGADTNVGGGGRTGPTGTEIIEGGGGRRTGPRPAENLVEQPAVREGQGQGEGVTPGPRTPREQFRDMVEEAMGPGRGDGFDMTVPRTRFERMTETQRQAAREAFERVRRADPLGDPKQQLHEIMEAAQNGVPVPEIIARTAARDPQFTNLEALAREAGVTPQRMREMVESQMAEAQPGQELYVDEAGLLRTRPQGGPTSGRTLHERQLMEMDPQGNRSDAAREARWRAERDAADGITPEQSLVGAAHNNEMSLAEFQNRTGQTRQQAQENLSEYLQERYRMSEAEANQAAAEWAGRGSTETVAPPGPETDPLTSPWGETPTGGETPPWQRQPGDTVRLPVAETPVGESVPAPVGPGETVRIPRAELERIVNEGGPGDTVRIPRAELERIVNEGGPGETVNIPRAELEALMNEGGPGETARIPRSEIERLMAEENRPVVEELTPEDLGIPARETPEQVVERLRGQEEAGEALSDMQQVERWQAEREIQQREDVRLHRERQAELLRRQNEVGEFDVPPRPGRQMRNPEDGNYPRRPLVRGDANYVRNIMENSPYRRTQPDVSGQVVNRYVEQMLAGEFPTSPDGMPITIGSQNQIVQGHHRLIAAQVVRQLTGRPLTEGPNRIIPEGEIVTDPGANPPASGWNGVGVD